MDGDRLHADKRSFRRRLALRPPAAADHVNRRCATRLVARPPFSSSTAATAAAHLDVYRLVVATCKTVEANATQMFTIDHI